MDDNIIVEFNYESIGIPIQGKKSEKMKNIIQRFFNKMGEDFSKKKIYFSYNGQWENDSYNIENFSFLELANEQDKKRKKMNILVAENTTVKEDLIIKSNEIICPQCWKYILMKLENYRISLYGCEKGHSKDNILLEEFENTQFINFAKITCGFCGEKRSNIFENEMQICLNCGKNLCPLCRSQHEKTHALIKYDQVNYICKEDNDYFIGYCEDCEKHYCMSCESEHDDHEKIPLSSIIPRKKDLEKSLNELKQYIDIFNDECEEIINLINNAKKNFNIYYNIKKNMIDNFDIKNQKNYYIFNNLNTIINNDQIIKDINNIKNEVSLENKFNFIINIYNDMNNTKRTDTKLKMDLSKENEELRRKCLVLKQSLDEAKPFLEKEKKYELIKKIIFAGIDKKQNNVNIIWRINAY